MYAIRSYYDDGLHFRNTESEQLSVKLLDKLGLQGGQSVFLNSGSEAVNLGIAIAQKLTRRNKVLKQDCSYLAAYGAGQHVITSYSIHYTKLYDAIFEIERILGYYCQVPHLQVLGHLRNNFV